MNYTDIMFDCETFSTRPTAKIVQLAAVPFNRRTGQIGAPESETFNAYLDWHDTIDRDFHVDDETVRWWDKQALFPQLQHNIATRGTKPAAVVSALVGWIRHVCYRLPGPAFPVRVWSYGASADMVWIEYLLRHFNHLPPWSYKNVRCLRTVLADNPWAERVQPAIPHDALCDALAQAQTLVKIPTCEDYTVYV